MTLVDAVVWLVASVTIGCAAVWGPVLLYYRWRGWL